MSLPAITAVLTASTEGFETALNRAIRASATASQQISEHTEKISSSYERLQKVAEAAVAVFAIEKFAGLIEGSVQAAEQLERLSQRTGIAVESLGGIGFAAKQSGIDLETASSAFVKLDRTIASATAGNKEAGAAFAAIGISLSILKNSSPDQVLGLVADKFASYEDGANKSALALALFGKAGAELIPLLNKGGAALAENTEYFKRYSGVTAELTEKAAAFAETQTKISLLTGAFANNLTAALLPAMQGIASAFLDLKEDGDQFKSLAGDIAEVLKEVAVAATFGVEALFEFRNATKELGEIGSALASGTLLKDYDAIISQNEGRLAQQKQQLANLREQINRPGDSNPFANRPIDFGHGRGQAPSILSQQAKDAVDPLVAYLDNLNKEGLKFHFDTDNFDRFKGAMGTSKAALVEFDVEYGKFSDAARAQAKLPLLTSQQKQDLIAAGKAVAEAAEGFKRIEALHAFDENVKQINLQTQNIGKSNDQVEISTKLFELQKAGIKDSGDTAIEYAKRVVDITAAVEKLTAAQQKQQLAAFAYQGGQAHDEAVFQLSVVGKTKDQIEDLTAARQIDLNVQRQARNEAGDLRDPSGKQLADLQAEAEKQKAQLAADTAQTREAQRSALTGSQEFFRQYVEDAKDAASQVRGALTDAFSAAEDSFVQFATTGKISFASLAQSIESDVAKIGFKYLASQGIQAAQGAFGADSTIGKLLGAASGASSAGGAVGGLSTASSTAALMTFSTTVTAANAPLLALTEASTQAALALSTIAASGGASSVSGLAGAAGAAGDSDDLGDLLDVLGSAMGNVFSGGNVVPFANGGVVSRPTIFPMRTGMGLMGEAGPEAIMPLKRGRGGKLGVAVHGDAAPVTNNYINVPAPQPRDMLTARQYGENIRRALG